MYITVSHIGYYLELLYSFNTKLRIQEELNKHIMPLTIYLFYLNT